MGYTGHMFVKKDIDYFAKDSLAIIKFKCPTEGCDEVFAYEQS